MSKGVDATTLSDTRVPAVEVAREKNQQVWSGKTDSSQPDGQNSERQLETWAPSCELILMSDPAGCVEVESAHEDISNSDRGEFYKIPGLYSKYHSSDNDNLKN